MRITVIILTILLFSGCFTNYRNVVDATIEIDNYEESAMIDSTLFTLVKAIATKNSLVYDSEESVYGKSAGYYGHPYHYYLFTILDSSTNNSKVIRFLHDARMSLSKNDFNEPEYMLIDSLKKIFPSNIQNISIVHKP